MFVVNNNSMRVYASPEVGISLELMRVMERMVQSDRPMFLLTNGGMDDPNGDRQVWINQLACDMIQSAVTRRAQLERAFESGSCTLETAIILAAATGCRFQMACLEVEEF